MRIISPLVALLVSITLAATAHADPDGGGRTREARHARLERRFDIDRDGRLDPAERVALRSYTYARLVRRYDLDHDGRLGPGEVPPAIAARLQRLDRNHDGWIEPGEVILPRRQPRAR
jgi:EF hand